MHSADSAPDSEPAAGPSAQPPESQHAGQHPPRAQPHAGMQEAQRTEPHAEVFVEFTFEAAHRLPHVPPTHKCARLHGHSFRVTVHVRGPVDRRTGFVVDFADLHAAWAPLGEQLDHRYLNEVEGLDNPTSEKLAQWIWQRLQPALPGLCQITVRETCTSGVVYRGPGC